MIWNNWINRWEKTLERIEKLGGERNGLSIYNPASEEDVIEVEKKLGYRLPESFRFVLLNFAEKVEFTWYLNDCIVLPKKFSGIFAGECIWNLKNLIEYE